MKKTIIVAAFIIMICCLISCNAESEISTVQNVSTTDTEASSQETLPEYQELEAVDYNGNNFRILTIIADNYCKIIDNISSEQISGEVLNDAIFERNNAVSEKYNIVIDIINDSSVISAARKSIHAGDNAYDTVFAPISSTCTATTENLFYELTEIPYLNIEADWWNKQIMDDMSVKGRYYMGINDMMIQAYYSSGIVYFNKQLALEYELESPYELVLNEKWTFDKLQELCHNVSKDLNGNSELDEKDQYGITYNNFGWQIMYYGSGEPVVKRSDTGNLYFDASNERSINYLQKLIPSAQDNTATLYSENFGHVGGTYRIDVCKNAFNEGRVLFWLEAMYGIPNLRDMEHDFGVLPAPKADEAQESYYSFIHTNHGTCISIPITVEDTDMVGHITEDLAYYSGELVRDAFIETTLKGKYARDNDSADMIDIIIDGIRTDYVLMLVGRIPFDETMRKAMDAGTTDIASIFAQNESAYNAVLDEYCSYFK